MRLPYIAITVLIFTIWLNLRINKSTNLEESRKRAFWDRERMANSTRKQSLEALPYIRIPEDIPPDGAEALSSDASDAAKRIRRLREEDAKIVNLTGYTNTDLKLEYGVANISELMLYDGHYTLLASDLQTCAQGFHDAGMDDQARRILEFAVETGTDVTASYRLLVGLYRNTYDTEAFKEKLQGLLSVADDLRALSRDGIVAMLEQAVKDCDR